MAAGYLDEEHLAVSIAWMYYQEGLTQEAIAARLGLTRVRVNRTLNEARASGLVRITVNHPLRSCLEAEQNLRNRFHLREARVVPAAEAPRTRINLIGQAAGTYLDGILRDGQSLALGWGRTVEAALPALSPRRGRDHTVVSLFGGLPMGDALNPYDATARFARTLDARRYYVTAPMFVSSPEARDILCAEPSVRTVLDRAVQADVALISASDLGDDSKNLVYNVIDRPLRASLVEAGAVGDSCGIYLDAKGGRVEHPVTRRMIVPDYHRLLEIPTIVLASGGSAKVPILLACLRAGLGNVLITDEQTARELLAQA